MKNWNYLAQWKPDLNRYQFLISVEEGPWWAIMVHTMIMDTVNTVCERLPRWRIPNFPVRNKYEKKWEWAHEYCAETVQDLWCYLMCHSMWLFNLSVFTDKFISSYETILTDTQVKNLIDNDPDFMDFYVKQQEARIERMLDD